MDGRTAIEIKVEEASKVAGPVPPGIMLAVLVASFALSHVFRTLPAVLGSDVARQFALDAQQLGLFAGAFHLAFAALQLPVGVALDRFGPRRTVASLYALACAGTVVSAMAGSFAVLVIGQLLIGAGCSAALMGSLVFVTRWYPPARFSALSGLVVALGGLGMLLSATPAAWLVAALGWRGAFAGLAVLSAAVMIACALLVRDAPSGQVRPPEGSLAEAMRGIGAVLRRRETAGILALGLTAYPVGIAFRGLWIGPYLADRFGLGTVAIGNALLGVSLGMIVGPLLFGRVDPGGAGRRRLIVAAGVLTALSLAALAGLGGESFAADYATMLLFALVSSFYVLQFAIARVAYPPHLVGRGFSMLNMAVFAGVALAQWVTGLAADHAGLLGLDVQSAVLWLLAAIMVAGVVAFALLPAPRSDPDKA